MNERYDESKVKTITREQLIGLGENSLRKSYYPELQQRMADLQRFRTLLDQSQDLIFLFKVPSGQAVDFNESACLQLGYSKEKLLSASFDVLVSEPGPVWFRILNSHSSKAASLAETSVATFCKSDGTHIPVEVTSSRVTFENDQYAVVVARDITERLRVEEELRKAHSMLEERVKERTTTLVQLSETLLAEIAERKRIEEQLRHLSMHDFTTGLYNRAYFSEEMHRLNIGRSHPIGLIMCDVDGLKMVNDALGHVAGDQLLSEAAKILRMGVREEDIVSRVGGDEFAILLPNSEPKDLKQIITRIRFLVETYNQSNPSLPLSLSMGFAAAWDKASNMDEIYKEADDNMYKDKLERRLCAHKSITHAFFHILEAKDYIKQGHTIRLRNMSTALAKAVDLPGESINALKLLAEYHDLGKVGVSDLVLQKAGRLTPEERNEKQRHCEIGRRIAQSVPELAPIADLILKHHEWWNGKGYPLGLRGEEIPVECRILAIADAYDAMTDNRCYRSPISNEEALAELRKCAGTQFDESLVESFVAIMIPASF